MKKLDDKIALINSKDDFIKFIEILIGDFKNNSKEWENKDLESYLGAISSWVEDMEGYYHNHNIEIPKNIDWKFLASIFLAARIYE